MLTYDFSSICYITSNFIRVEIQRNTILLEYLRNAGHLGVILWFSFKYFLSFLHIFRLTVLTTCHIPYSSLLLSQISRRGWGTYIDESYLYRTLYVTLHFHMFCRMSLCALDRHLCGHFIIMFKVILHTNMPLAHVVYF